MGRWIAWLITSISLLVLMHRLMPDIKSRSPQRLTLGNSPSGN
jgi:hypothetical protein